MTFVWSRVYGTPLISPLIDTSLPNYGRLLILDHLRDFPLLHFVRYEIRIRQRNELNMHDAIWKNPYLWRRCSRFSVSLVAR